MTYTHILQQEDYDNSRLFKWIFRYKTFDKRMTTALLVSGAVWFFIPEFFTNFLVFICFVILTYTEKDPRKSLKKKLIATPRAKRLFFPAFLLLIIMGIPCFYFQQPWFWIFNVQMVPIVLVLMNMILKPVEDIIQQIFWNEAHEKIEKLQPKVIAITGSFGKTSVKHILAHILKSQALTLVTPGSVNTSMGIARVVREQLTENHKYLIVEMGAYGPGSIARLCRLTPPDIGIITSIGHAHYERFKSLETVAKAKFELATSVIRRAGKVIIHERTLRFPLPRQLKTQYPDHFLVCGESPELNPHKTKDLSFMEGEDLHIQEIQQMPTGLEIKLTWQDRAYHLDVPLYGIQHGHNVALAFATAMELGVSYEDIQTSLKSLPQITHRLEVKKQPDDTILIDDAYNSNPLGFRYALDLIAIMKKSGRSIIVTPGMIELGIAHNEAHEKLGTYAGEVCDVAVVINSKRIESFIKGFKKTGGSKTLVEVDSFQEASIWVEKNKQAGDVILIENDLPDMYERIPKT